MLSIKAKSMDTRTVAVFSTEIEAMELVWCDPENLICEQMLCGRWHVLDLG